MTGPNELSPQTGPEGLNSMGQIRYRLTLAPSPELSEYIEAFLTNSEIAKLHLSRRAVRLSLMHDAVIQTTDNNRNRELDAQVSDYAKAIEDYSQSGRQLRLGADGFEYAQQRSSRAAFTSLSLELALSPKARLDIVRPPFFKNGLKEPIRARVVFPNNRVVPDTDHVALDLEYALATDHPSAINGMAQFAFYMSNLRISEDISYPGGIRALSVVKDRD